jgi:hypothetical protein
MENINYKELLEKTIRSYEKNPMFIDKRKDRVEYSCENGEISLRIGGFILKNMDKKELEDSDFKRFYYRLIEVLFDKL